MEDILNSGALAAALGVEADHPDVQPLIPDALEVGLSQLRENGHYPINHLVVVKNEVLQKYPDLAADLFYAFVEAKRLYLERLKAGAIEKPTDVDVVHQRVMDIIGDPLPYGIEPNRKVLETLIQSATAQGIITKPVTFEDLFAKSTLNLVG